MGRAASKIEKIETQLQELETLQCPSSGSCLPNLHLAKDLEVSRLSMPLEPPGFDPCPFLDEELRDLYLRPSARSVPMREAPVAPPRVQVRASCKAEKLELLSLRDRASRLKLSDASSVDFSKACGLFAIPKGVDADRLIVDGRPANLCVEADTRWLCMLASASNLLDLELLEGEELRMSGEDVKDYYHQFRVSDDRTMQYTLIDVFWPHDLQHLRAFSPELWACPTVAASFATLAMGDTNSVTFGQASHVGLVLSSGAVSVSQLLTLRGRLPRCPLCLGVVIDELVILERVARGDSFSLAACHSPCVASLLKRAYSSANLPTHPKKSFFMDKVAHFGVQMSLGILGLYGRPGLGLFP